MSLLEIALPLLLLALLVVLLRSAPAVVASSNPKARYKLPSPAAAYRLSRRADWVVERHGITLSASTGGLNSLPKRVLASIGARSRDKVLWFYDAGVVVSVAGIAVGILGAIWALGRVWWAVWAEAEAHARVQHAAGAGLKPRAGEGLDAAAEGAARIIKRAVVDAVAKHASGIGKRDAPPPQLHSADGGLQPLIPGITTPLSHLPTLVLALVVAELIHEAGHALAAALDDVSPAKFALNLHLVLPSASVIFPANAVDYLPFKAHARLATAGPWHNLVLWLALFALGGLSPLAWGNSLAEGRAVVAVAQDSELRAHLRPGDILTHVDDIFLGGKEDIWTKYLTGQPIPLGTPAPAEPNGWCVSKYEFDDAPRAPCAAHHLVGFVRAEHGGGSETHCLAAHNIISMPSTECHCPLSHICVNLSPLEHILRIRTKRGSKRDVVLWSGDKEAVLQQVEVGTKVPRFWGAGTRWADLFLAYLKMVTLSLFVFNLLPLPSTDGIHLLNAVLQSRGHQLSRPARQLVTNSSSRHPTINLYRYDEGSDSDDSAGGPGTGGGGEPAWATGRGRREEVWARRLRRVVEGSMSALLAAWALGWAMLALLRSS
ncbi:hypothetical protein Q8F55_003168 [Vanrija albida]|uniref:Endopeptidase S2P n=1 Tax=Vanrija albida TaxID=181172 RepID=A0ABR3QBT3_9TREE